MKSLQRDDPVRTQAGGGVHSPGERPQENQPRDTLIWDVQSQGQGLW